MEITGDPPPLWPQLTTTASRRRQPSPIFSLPILIIILPIIALILLSVVPPFLSGTVEILKPIGVKNSWDSLNVFLVLFAIIIGVFSRRNDDDDSANGNAVKNDIISERDSAPINVRHSPATSVRRLKRSSSSYPDLRQDSLWENNNEDRFRFFDDFEINKYRSSMSYDDRVHELRTSWRTEFEESETKIIPVDTFVLRPSPSKSPSPSTPHPPPPPGASASRRKPRRTYQAVRQKDKNDRVEYNEINSPSVTPPPPPPPPRRPPSPPPGASASRRKPRRTYQAGRQKDKNDRVEYNEIKSPSVTPPPPPPPPPRRPPSPLVSVGNVSEQKHTKLQRRKSNATKEIKMVFASLRKRKKKHKSKDYDQDCALHSPTEPPPQSPAPPPPPPPPPPPSSVFQKYNIFRKGSKSKKIHFVPAPPPPPPPATFSSSKRSSKQTTQMVPPTPPPAPLPPPEPPIRRTTANNGRPPLPTKANTTTYHDQNANIGGKSPLIPMPPPSPPPPFKMADFKFMYREDSNKIRNSPSSRCSSPDLEEVDVPSSKDETETVSLMNGDDHVIGVSAVPVYCPSPDVNAKAETFIARLRDGWKLENKLAEREARDIN